MMNIENINVNAIMGIDCFEGNQIVVWHTLKNGVEDIILDMNNPETRSEVFKNSSLVSTIKRFFNIVVPQNPEDEILKNMLYPKDGEKYKQAYYMFYNSLTEEEKLLYEIT